MKPILLLFISIQLFFLNVNSQSLSESLGGIKTNFQIFSDSTDMKVTDQMIIKRAEKNTKVYTNGTYGYAYGYGYQSYHLEFVTQEAYTRKQPERKSKKDKDKLVLTFYGADDDVMASHSVDFTQVDLKYSWSSKKIRFFYSIDLKDIPMVLLENTVKINIVKVSHKK